MAKNQLSYPYEKFMVAIYSLASSSSLKERIYSAYLSFHPLKSSDFKEFPEIQVQFDELMRDLTKATAKGDEGKVMATLNSSSVEELEALASKVVDIHLAIARERFE